MYILPAMRIIRFLCESNIRANIPIYVANIPVACGGNAH